MNFVDTHCHLFLEEFDADRKEIVDLALSAGVKKLILPNVDYTTVEPLKSSVTSYAYICYAAWGIHPCSIKENYQAELPAMEKILTDDKPIAIGEIGLDLYWDKTFFKEQIEALHIQLNWSKLLNIPVILHTREALDECIEEVSKHKGVTGVFHSFSGTEEQIKKIADLGFYYGIGGVATFKNAGLDKVIKFIPKDRLLLETDAPYLTPVPFRGKRNEPSYIPLIAEKIASLYEVELNEIADICWENSHKLFFNGNY
jgi:TatD DNase family protein